MADDIILNVMNEPVRLIEEPCDPMPGRSVAFLERGEYIPGTLALFQMPGNVKLYEGHHWTADPSDGQINLSEPLLKGTHLSADYRVFDTEH